MNMRYTNKMERFKAFHIDENKQIDLHLYSCKIYWKEEFNAY